MFLKKILKGLNLKLLKHAIRTSAYMIVKLVFSDTQYNSVIMKKWNRACKQTLSVKLLFKRLAGGEVARCRNYEKWNAAHCDYWIFFF